MLYRKRLRILGAAVGLLILVGGVFAAAAYLSSPQYFSDQFADAVRRGNADLSWHMIDNPQVSDQPLISLKGWSAWLADSRNRSIGTATHGRGDATPGIATFQLSYGNGAAVWHDMALRRVDNEARYLFFHPWLVRPETRYLTISAFPGDFDTYQVDGIASPPIPKNANRGQVVVPEVEVYLGFHNVALSGGSCFAPWKKDLSPTSTVIAVDPSPSELEQAAEREYSGFASDYRQLKNARNAIPHLLTLVGQSASQDQAVADYLRALQQMQDLISRTTGGPKGSTTRPGALAGISELQRAYGEVNHAPDGAAMSAALVDVNVAESDNYGILGRIGLFGFDLENFVSRCGRTAFIKEVEARDGSLLAP